MDQPVDMTHVPPDLRNKTLVRITERLIRDREIAHRHVFKEYSHEAGVVAGISHAIAVIHDEIGKDMGRDIPHG